ncbi:MAG: hypothetical protein GXX79_20260 [Actinomycetales bacterium]|nr:hypothetical protein [Actinomycetales bacterium]
MDRDSGRAPAGEFLTPPPHRTLIVTLALIVVGSLVVTLFVWAPWGGSSPTARPTTSSPSGSTKPPVSTPVPTSSSPVPRRRVLIHNDLPGGSGPVVLPRGHGRVGLIRTGYPRSARGAVAAAVEYSRFLGPLDEESAAAFVRAAVDPNWAQGAATVRQGVRNNRAWLGVPESGQIPDGVSLTVAPMAFQLAPDTPLASPLRSSKRYVTEVRVLVLAFMTGTSPSVNTGPQVAVFPLDLCWSHGDWKIATAATTDAYMHLAARPGTPAAVAAGWREYLA